MRTLKFTAALLFMLFGIGSCVLANAAETHTGRVYWTRAVIADEVAITVHVVSVNELVELQTSRRADARSVRLSQHRGLAKLYRNTATGAWTCHVYVTANARADTLEHEQQHCHGWVHQ